MASGVPAMDFSIIGDLGKTYQNAQRQAVRERTLAELGNNPGPLDFSAAAKRVMSVDPELGMSLASLGQRQANTDRDFNLRRDEIVRTQGNVDRLHDLQERQFRAGIEGGKVEPGWEKTPAGLRPIPGGKADPAYVRSLNEAQAKPRDFNYGDISKLTEEGAKFSAVNGFIQNFKPEYVKPFGLGAARNYLARTLPSAITEDTARAAASYWQNYDRYKNVVRNDLFGSALTLTEQAAFEKADINPSMNPDVIKTNLAEQQRILQAAMKKKAASLIASKFNPQAISEAYGVPLQELGVTQGGQSGGAPRPGPQDVPTWTDPATNKTYKIINGVPHE